jgi:hypothetical protein
VGPADAQTGQLTVPDPLAVRALDAGACVAHQRLLAVFARVALNVVQAAVEDLQTAPADLLFLLGGRWLC